MTRATRRSFRGLGVLATVAVLTLCGLLLVPGTARADVVHMRDGRTLEGEIIEETERTIRLRRRFGVMTIRRGDILRIERSLTPRQQHARDLEECETADDYYELGVWARDEHELEELAEEDFRRAIEVDPGHEEAREALGHRRLDGEWVTAREYHEAQGHVQFEGEWVTPEEARRLREQRREEMRQRAEDAHAQYEAELEGVPWVEAHRVETEHYRIVCNAGQDDSVARRYGEYMEMLHEAYSRIFGAFPRRFHDKMTIFIIRNHQEFMEMFHVPPGVGGFFRPGSFLNLPPRVVTAYHGTFGETGDTYAVLAHEGTHQFENLVLQGANEGQEAVVDFMCRPDWVLEGLAVYFGDGAYVDGDEIEVGIPRDRLRTLQRAIRSDDVIALRELIRIPHSEFGGQYYAPAWGFIYYMVNRRHVTVDGQEVDLQRVFQDFFRFLTEDPPQPQAQNPEYYASRFEEMLGVDIDALDEDWHEYILGLELEPVGELRGTRYTSEQLGFGLRLASRRWEGSETGLRGPESMSFIQERTSGRVSIVSTANASGMTPRDLSQAFLERLYPNQVLDDIRIERQDSYFHQGYDGWEAVYTGDFQEPEGEGVYHRDARQKFRSIFFTTHSRLFVVTFHADEDRWDRVRDDFDEMLESFEILPTSD